MGCTMKAKIWKFTMKNSDNIAFAFSDIFAFIY